MRSNAASFFERSDDLVSNVQGNEKSSFCAFDFHDFVIGHWSLVIGHRLLLDECQCKMTNDQ